LMLSKTGFTHSDLLCWQSDYAGGSLNVNGTIMRDTYINLSGKGILSLIAFLVPSEVLHPFLNNLK
ncbi:hypothetical protein, partial [Citrobacter portucalensis]|uniref:hypothetical protein n=1 Tax=Citrobacter portucalensis TaxID=1639133 RepID=UPI0040415E89